MGMVGASAKKASINAVTAAAVAATVVGVGTVASTPTQLRQFTLSTNTIPIVDFHQTFGPLILARTLDAVFDRSAQEASAALEATSLTQWAQLASASWALNLPVDFAWDPSHPMGVSLTPSWSVGAAAATQAMHFTLLNGGQSLFKPTLFGNAMDGYGAGFEGVLYDGSTQGSLFRTINSQTYGAATGASSVVGALTTKFGVLPSGGAYGHVSTTPISTAGFAQVLAGPLGGVSSGLGLGAGSSNTICVGSAVSHCGGEIASTHTVLNVNASLARVTPVGGYKPLGSINLPEQFDAQVTPGQLSVSGHVGGEVTVGQRTVGKIVPFGFTVPLPTANSALARNQASSLAPQRARLSASGTTRAQSAVSRVRTAISKTLNGKPSHAQGDANDSST